MESIINIITNLPTLLLSSGSQGVLWALLAIGVYITYRLLDVADLTVEGSFPLGGSVAAACIVGGIHPAVATIMGFVAGAIAGLVSGLLNTKLKIPALLAGIITMTGLYSINSRIMGKKANLPLLGEKTVFTWLLDMGFSKQWVVLIVGAVICAVVILALIFFLKTEVGLSLRATGDNQTMSEANGVNTDLMKLLGYMLSNGCVALSGALIAQNNGFSDLNSGVGTIVIGLASIIIAEVLFKNKSLPWRFVTIVIGTIIYRFVLAIIFEFPIDAQDIKLFSALILILCLTLPLIQQKLNKSSRKKASKERGDVK